MIDITLQYPYALIVIPLYILCTFICKSKKQSIYFSNLAMLKEVSSNQAFITKSLKFLLIVFLSLALSSPIKKDDVILNDNKGYEISLILDASGSMIEANKFKVTKEILQEFIKQRKADRLALSIFADFAYVAVPLTYDKKSLLDLLKFVEVGIAGQRQTALYEALFLSSNLFKNSKAKEKIAILLTDGFDTTNSIPLDVAIAKAKKYNIKVYTVGVGAIGDYDPSVLEQIAAQTGGKFFQADTFEKLQAIYDHINSLEKSEIKTQKYVQKEYFFMYPLDIAIALLFMLLIINRKYS
jgi:Ca-activated chloride channel family protein